MTNPNPPAHPGWGGHREGSGRPPQPGYQKLTSARFLDKSEEAIWNSLSPRRRVEILIAFVSAIGPPPQEPTTGK